MIEKIYKRGFTNKFGENTYSRDNWIIRFYDNEVEIYENVVEYKLGKYFYGKTNEIDLDLILDEIDELGM